MWREAGNLLSFFLNPLAAAMYIAIILESTSLHLGIAKSDIANVHALIFRVINLSITFKLQLLHNMLAI